MASYVYMGYIALLTGFAYDQAGNNWQWTTIACTGLASISLTTIFQIRHNKD